MARLDQLSPVVAPRKARYFSEDFKRKKVEELDKNLVTVAEICRQYSVSYTAVYKWIYKYSLMRKKAVKMVVEAQSDTARIKALQEHIAQLEQLIGKQQFELAFKDKQLQIISEQYGVDVKKKLSGPPFDGSGNTDASTTTP